MEEKQPSQKASPHDRFFRITFSDKEKVADYLNGSLPGTIKGKINFDTLHLDNTSYVDKDLKNFYSDVVYDALFDGKTPIKIAFLFEHKSYVPTFPHLQLLAYMLKIWERQLANKQKPRPVLPIIIYHGKDKWQQKPFGAYFETGEIDKDLLPYTPVFDYWLTDLQSTRTQEIDENYTSTALRVAFKLMKHIFDDDLDKHLDGIFAGWEGLKKSEEGRNFISIFLLYLHSSPKMKDIGMKLKVEDYFSEEDIPEGSLFWDWMKKREEETEKRVKKERDLELAKILLKKGFPAEEVSEVTGLPLGEVEKLNSCL